MTIANAHGNAILDGLSVMSFSLHTADPGNAGANNEVTGGSYARQTVNFGTASNKSHTSTGTTTFAAMPAATVTHGALWVSGACKFYGPLSSSFVISSGQTLQFAPGEITNTLT